MSEKKVCINCPGATDHSTAECPMRAQSAEGEAVEVKAYMGIDGIREPLMTVAQHQRIVVAKDAEIAHLKEAIGPWVDRAANWAKVNDNLRALLAAQANSTPSAEVARLTDLAYICGDQHEGCLYKFRLGELRNSLSQRISLSRRTGLIGRLEAERDELFAQLAAQQAAVPVAIVDCSDDACWADILDDVTVKVGQKLYAHPAAPQQGDGEAYTDCRSEEGVTVGLIDTIINSARLLKGRSRTPAVEAALEDLRADDDVAGIFAHLGDELWAVHAQGPDDLYAAASKEDAERHAAELNAIPTPAGISVAAVVIPSPWPAVEHWKYLAEQNAEYAAELLARLNADRSAQTDYPECSGDESDCPENEGRGCCGKDRSAQGGE